MARILAAHASALLAFGVFSCASQETVAPEDSCAPEQWAPDTDNYRSWRHDCDPYVGSHFTVYSDGSSLAAKTTLAGIAEDVFSELTGEFVISDANLEFTPSYTYYIFAYRYISAPSEAYRNGFLTQAIDRGPSGLYERDPVLYHSVLKHELMHVFQFTLTDCPKNSACPYWLDVWFREGQAVYVGGDFSIPTLPEYRAWVSNETYVNPLSIRRWTDFPDPDRGGAYYPMFALVYAYLVDGTRGLGVTNAECLDLFQYMKDGDPFDRAFERAFGITIAYMRENFYEIMEEYLDR
jgi:hypothetical protein